MLEDMGSKFKTKFDGIVGDLQGLCLECGLCCNGVLFGDVRLQVGDDLERLRELGLKISKGGRFKQPCAALEGCECRVYADRPSYCRKFECLLFGRVKRREIETEEARRVVKKARAAVARVEELLSKLGTDEKNLPLRKRFQSQVKRMDRSEVGREQSELFAELTLAFHGLDVLLRKEFYR
jgi:Fe-S-cluster containining protein